MAASHVARFGVPVGAAFLFQGSVLADGTGNRPHPAAVYAEPSIKDADLCEPRKSGLPAGTDLNGCCKQQRVCQDTELEKLVMSAREGMGPYKDTVMCYVNQGLKQVNFYYDKLLDNICYLRTGAPQEVRIGTIVASGVTGMLFGIRGGIAKKLFLGTLGAGGGAYMTYPYETEKYTKKYTQIAYNFVAGTNSNGCVKHGKPSCESPVARRQAEKQASQP